MLFKSEAFTQVSGSIGGATYAHNSAGMYRRSRTIPVNPNTAAQQDVRNNLSTLALAWNNDLTEAERIAWSNYSELTPGIGALGDALTLAGQQMYIRCNTVRLRAGISRVDPGPTTSGLVDLTTPVATLSIAATNISVAYTDTDGWANEVGGALVIQTSRFLSPGINFFKGPLRFLGAVEGGVTPPTSPETSANNAFAQPLADATDGQKLMLRYTAFEADGRLSSVSTELVTVVP